MYIVNIDKLPTLRKCKRMYLLNKHVPRIDTVEYNYAANEITQQRKSQRAVYKETTIKQRTKNIPLPIICQNL